MSIQIQNDTIFGINYTKYSDVCYAYIIYY